LKFNIQKFLGFGIENFTNFFYQKLKNAMNNNTKIAFLIIKRIDEDKINSKRKMKLKIILKLRDYYASLSHINQNKKYKQIFRRWKTIITNQAKIIKIDEKQNKISAMRLIKIKFIIQNKYEKNLKFFFLKFKINCHSINKHNTIKIFSKSQHISRIDYYIIENQSKILVDIEQEEVKLIKEIVKNKFPMNKGSIIINRILSNHIIKIKFYFKRWKNNIFNNEGFHKFNHYETILCEADLVKNEHENLILIYQEKRQNYQKTVQDYEYIKKHFCEECVNEGDFVLDYKSLNSHNENVSDDELQKTNSNCVTKQSNTKGENINVKTVSDFDDSK
jgi:hypothetical protein